jgi:hypothetical protein
MIAPRDLRTKKMEAEPVTFSRTDSVFSRNSKTARVLLGG